ncbi:MAG: XapX domain-containing protein [Treponema sp.]|nr:XapX domain-containing protein [Treponema sp.]
MLELLVCLVVGLVIGGIFGLFKLPLPVPHGLGGVLGLIGMFIGGQIIKAFV